MTSYFGYRPVLIFNTRLRFKDENDTCKAPDSAAAVSRPKIGGEDQEARDTNKNLN